LSYTELFVLAQQWKFQEHAEDDPPSPAPTKAWTRQSNPATTDLMAIQILKYGMW
jgi:hypothetical protein